MTQCSPGIEYSLRFSARVLVPGTQSVPGRHCGIEGNELADKLAREGALCSHAMGGSGRPLPHDVNKINQSVEVRACLTGSQSSLFTAQSPSWDGPESSHLISTQGLTGFIFLRKAAQSRPQVENERICHVVRPLKYARRRRAGEDDRARSEACAPPHKPITHADRPWTQALTSDTNTPTPQEA